jgi:hypothetical protein
MKSTFLPLLVLLQATTYSEARHVSFDKTNGGITWLPVTLTDTEREMLSKRSERPKTALDYYLLLSSGYFRNISDSLERRITFIDRETLSDGYLHAAYTIPRTDAGAFEITIRLYEKDKEPLIAIQHLGGSEAIYQSSSNSGGKLMAITVNRPEFWRYRDGAWLRVEDAILPGITVGDVLTRYRDHYKAHLYQPTQQKYIHLAYDLPREGTVVQVTGRENFMDPGKKEVWAEFNYDGDRFLPSAKAK